jgi:predicted amidohydrolase
VRASLIQIGVDEKESVNTRRERAASLVREQAGADLVVLPELWTTGAFAYEAFAAEAEPLDGPTYEAMAKAAGDADVWLHAGSVPERGADGALYNTSLVFSPEGQLAAAYRKIHRFGFDKGEAVLMGAGSELVTVRLPETTLGLATCYDLRFPGLFQELAGGGATVIVVPASWGAGPGKREQWDLLVRARALDSTAFVAACDQADPTTVGRDAGKAPTGIGASAVVGPLGTIQAQLGAEPDLLVADLDLDAVEKARAAVPVLANRRF